MTANIETIVRAALVASLLGAAASSSVAAQQATEPAPSPAVPGITVTPGLQPRGARPQPLVPDARGGSQPNRESGEPQRVQPHGGCQYDEQPLELIV